MPRAKNNVAAHRRHKKVLKKAREDAKKMLKKKYPIAEIAEITGLTKDEIEQLK